VVRETPVRSIAPEFDAHDTEMADRIMLREYLCPVTGFRSTPSWRVPASRVCATCGWRA
jgi:hypothetical protein